MSKARRRAAALYGALGALTLIFELVVRPQQCTAIGACAAGIGKALIWSLIWPAFWIFYLGAMQGQDALLLLVLLGIVVPYAFVMLYALSFLLRPFQWLADGLLREWLGRHLSSLLAAGLSAGLLTAATYAALSGLDLPGQKFWALLAALWAISILLIEVDLYGRVEGFRRSLWRD